MTKDQPLSISSGRVETRPWIKTKDGSTIYSSPIYKILSFVFSNKPNVEAQVSNLIGKANSRTFILGHYSTFMEGKDLILLYNSLVRSILEYSSITYGPMLTKLQANRLEQVQKCCLEIMSGYNQSYMTIF